MDEVIPYATHGEGTVLDHLKRAIDFSMNHLGAHGMPAGLHADWNDCLRLGAAGESSFVAMQLYLALRLLDELMPNKPENDEYRVYLRQKAEEQKALINQRTSGRMTVSAAVTASRAASSAARTIPKRPCGSTRSLGRSFPVWQRLNRRKRPCRPRSSS